MYAYFFAIALLFFAAGVIKGLVGIAFPAVILGALSFFMDPREVLGLIIFSMIVTNFRQALHRRTSINLFQRYRHLFVTVCIFVALSAYIGGRVPTPILLFCVGGAIFLFAIISLITSLPRLPEKHDRIAQTLTGMIVGTLGGLTAIVGPPMAIYLMLRRVERDEFMRLNGILFLSASLLIGLSMTASGEIDARTAWRSLFLVPFALTGLLIGERIRDQIDTEGLYRLILFAFILVGANLMLKGLTV